jgi:hypothetical protein
MSLPSHAAGAHPEDQIVDLRSGEYSDITMDEVFDDKVRGRYVILWGLFIIFGVTVIGAFWGALQGTHWANFKDLLDLLLPAETALLGVAVAFYMTSPST